MGSAPPRRSLKCESAASPTIWWRTPSSRRNSLPSTCVAAEVQAGEGAIDHGRHRLVLVIAEGEIAAGQQGRAERGEIARRDAVENLRALRDRFSRKGQAIHAARAGEYGHPTGCRALHLRQRGGAHLQLVQDGQLAIAILAGGGDGEHGDSLRLEARVHGCQVAQAEQEARAARHQAKRKRHLHSHEEAAHAQTAGLSAGMAQRQQRSRSGGLPRRQQAEKQRGDRADGGAEKQHARIQRQVEPHRVGLLRDHGHQPGSGRRPPRSHPQMPASSEISRLSVSSWRTSRARRAPSDTRSAISPDRAAERASSRLAVLAQAISRMHTETPSRIHNGRENVRRNAEIPFAPGRANSFISRSSFCIESGMAVPEPIRLS